MSAWMRAYALYLLVLAPVGAVLWFFVRPWSVIAFWVLLPLSSLVIWRGAERIQRRFWPVKP
jgi:hypothetical protein